MSDQMGNNSQDEFDLESHNRWGQFACRVSGKVGNIYFDTTDKSYLSLPCPYANFEQASHWYVVNMRLFIQMQIDLAMGAAIYAERRQAGGLPGEWPTGEEIADRYQNVPSETPRPPRITTTAQPINAPQPKSPPHEGGRQLDRAPKAQDRVPGDWWTCTATHYALIKDKKDPKKLTLEFWNEGREYREAFMVNNEKNTLWPASWMPLMKDDGVMHPFGAGKAVLVTQVVSDKQIPEGGKGAGNYYVNVTALESFTIPDESDLPI